MKGGVHSTSTGLDYLPRNEAANQTRPLKANAGILPLPFVETVVPTSYLFFHAILMIAVGQVEAYGVGKVEIDLIYEPVPFSEFAKGLLLLVLSYTESA